MFNYNKISNKIKDFSLNFSKNIANSLSLPISKAIFDFVFGICKSNSSLLSEIARALNENIKLKDTIDRLSKNLDKIFDNKDIIVKNYYKSIEKYINDDTCFHIDNSDINKDCSSKLEDLDKVTDASSKDKEIVNGYYITEIVATNSSSDLPISLYSNIFSTLSKDFKSENNETIKGINQITNYFGTVGTYIMDRGYDDKKVFEEFNNRNLKFIIRGKKNRNVIYEGKSINVKKFSSNFKGKYNINMKIKGKTVNASCSFAKIHVEGVKEPIYVVFVYFDKSVTIFYTNRILNCKEDVIDIVKKYYMRWRIEEYFKYKKQAFDFENFRVRSLKKINALNLILTIAIICLFLFSQSTLRLKNEIISISKPIKSKVYFEYYRITEGIRIILSKISKCVREKINIKKPPENTQICIFEMAL